MEPQNNNKKVLELIAVLAIFGLIVLVAVFVYKQLMTTAPSQVPPPAAPPIIRPEATVPVAPTATTESFNTISATGEASITLSIKDGKTTYKVGDPITLLATATAVDQIVGYDVVVPVDMQKMALVSKKNIVSEFQLITTAKKNVLYATGSLNLSVKTPVIFTNTKLFELTFKAVKPGIFVFKPTFLLPGKTEDSNLINNNTNDVLRKTDGVTVTVQ